MRLPLSWLKEYLQKLPTPQVFAEKLMMHGLEVEEIIDHTGDFKNVVVGEITAIRKHPNADKLRLAGVVLEPGEPAREIICGAPNIEVGQKVPVALLGATLPNGITIEKRNIRGIASNGMLCAEDELGLGKNHAGIMVLDAGLKVGIPFATAAGLDDVVFDIAIPANRSDLFSVRGLAREIGVITGLRPKITNNKLQIANRKKKSAIKIKVTDKKLCPIYTAQVIQGLQVQSSPMWLQNRLRLAGMRPINAVVDATNYIMLEYGQPLHAFDAAKVNGAITVRSAKAGELLTTLDKQNRKLDPSMLVITDAQGPIALAGVMGGANSEIGSSTSDIILESAIFDPVSIRKTSWKLGLQSEASRRFEKGLPRTLPMEASQAAAKFIVRLCGGTIEQGGTVAGTANAKPTVVSMKPKFLSDLLGISVTSAKAKSLLTKLGFSVRGAASWQITVPVWRLDVTTAEDVVDEVGRLHGYDKLPKSLLTGKPQKEIPDQIQFKEKIKNILVDLGFSEIVLHAFYGPESAGDAQGEHFSVANPLDATQHYLRRSLLPQMQEVLEREADAGHDAIVFEIGLVFDPTIKRPVAEQQYWKLSLGLTQKPPTRRLTELVEELYNKLKFKGDRAISFDKNQNQIIRGRLIKYHEFDLAGLEAQSDVQYDGYEFDRSLTDKPKQYRLISKYPTVTRDISLWIGPNLSLGKIMGLFQDEGGSLLHSAAKIDEFQAGEKHSLAFRLTFQSSERTLTKAEVDAIMGRLGKALAALGAIIR